MEGSVFRRRRVLLALRGGRQLYGEIHITEQQSLATWLARRAYLLNLTGAAWAGGAGPPMEHISVRSDRVLWVRPEDADLPLRSGAHPVVGARWAEFVLADGPTVVAGLYMSADQRLSDYIDPSSGFLPAEGARLAGTGEPLGDIAINTEALVAIREVAAPS